MKKKLGKDKQISFRSVPEIVTRLDVVAAKLAVAREFGGAKLRTGHLVNAVALWLVELPDVEAARIVGPMLDRLEVYLKEPDQAPAEPLSGIQLPSKRCRRKDQQLEPGDPLAQPNHRKAQK